MTAPGGWRRALAIGAGALLLYAVFLVATFPTAWVAGALAQATRGGWQLQYPDGSLWSGSARLTAAKGAPRELGELRWSINPLWLVLGKVQLNLQLTGPQAQARGALRIGYRSLELKDVEAALPAELAATLYATAAFLDPKGQLRLRTASLAASTKGLDGQAQILWERAGVRMSGANPLGDYRLDVTGQGENAQLTLATVSGRLQLSGQGQWQTTTGSLRFQGSAAAAQPDPQLNALLAMLGPDQGGGRRALNATLTLPVTAVLLP